MADKPDKVAPAAEVPKLSMFKDSMIESNSIITIIGKNTNLKAIYKSYGQYFDSMKQMQTIMEMLDKGESLVIDETCPRNRVEDLLYVHGN
jgi:hypothetical protein